MTWSRAGVGVAALALLALLAWLVAGRGEASPFTPIFTAVSSDHSTGVNANLSLRTVLTTGEHLPLDVTFTTPAQSFAFTTSNAHELETAVGSGSLLFDDACDLDTDLFEFSIADVGKGGPGQKTQYRTGTILFSTGAAAITLTLRGNLAGGHTLEGVLFLGNEGCTPLDLTFTFNGSSSPGGLPVVTNPINAGDYTLSGAYETAPSASHPEFGDECANALDDDGDGAVNDGCFANGFAEDDAGNPCLDPNSDGTDGCGTATACDNATDDGDDGDVNDGCPVVTGAPVTSTDILCIGTCAPTPTPTPTPAPTPTPCAGDSDCDGVLDGSDNCPNTPNPGQADWNGDNTGDACQESDSDSMGLTAAQVGGACPAPSSMARLRDCIEVRLGTAPGVPCPATSDPNDEVIDAWGPDFDDSRSVGGPDVFLLAQRFGSTTGFTPSGRLPYAARYDLNADDALNSLDVFVVALYFKQSC